MKLSNFCGEPSRLQKIAQLSEMLVCVLQCPPRPSRDIHRIATIRAQECSNLRCDRCPAAALLAPAVLELSTRLREVSQCSERAATSNKGLLLIESPNLFRHYAKWALLDKWYVDLKLGHF